MLIKYVGSGDEPPEKCKAFGYKFKMGKAVEVTEELAIRKLSRNPDFEVVLEGEAKVAKTAKKAAAKKVTSKKAPAKRRGRPPRVATDEQQAEKQETA